MPVRTPSEVLQRHFPPAIRGAQVSLATDEKLWKLPGRVLRLAQIFAAHTPLLALDMPVTCAREKAAELLGVCTRTITRYVKQLQDYGLIETVKQCYKKNEGWECLRFVWTSYGRTLFTEIDKSSPFKKASGLSNSSADGPATSPHDIAKNKSASSGVSTNLPAATKELEEAPRETILSPKPQAFKNNNLPLVNKPVPGDVAKKQIARSVGGIPGSMVEFARKLELTGQQVSMLFRECKLKGHWLQDILLVSIDVMERKLLKGGQAVAWIKDSLKRGTDYRWLVQVKQEKEEQQNKLAVEKERLESIKKSIRPGQRLPSGLVVDVICDDVVCFSDPLTGKQAGSSRLDDLAKFMDQYAGGAESKKHQSSEGPDDRSSHACSEKVRSISKQSFLADAVSAAAGGRANFSVALAELKKSRPV